jgi:hypothetical protein
MSDVDQHILNYFARYPNKGAGDIPAFADRKIPRQTLSRVEARIARRRDAVFLTREFRDLGGADQVLRALRELVREKRLLRLGYGVYGRAFVSRLSGAPVLTARTVLPAPPARLSRSLAWNGSRRRPSETTTKAARRRCRSIRSCA